MELKPQGNTHDNKVTKQMKTCIEDDDNTKTITCLITQYSQ